MIAGILFLIAAIIWTTTAVRADDASFWAVAVIHYLVAALFIFTALVGS